MSWTSTRSTHEPTSIGLAILRGSGANFWILGAGIGRVRRRVRRNLWSFGTRIGWVRRRVGRRHYGAGKSSIAGAMLVEEGVEYFNPDEAAELIRVANPGTTLEQSQSAAWDEGRRLLERAINERLDYAFETTLGGRTITALLEAAMDAGIEVRIWYVGLTNAELHIARVHARVKRGGHDIPEERIRQRYARSVLNLIQLMPKLTELRLYDNSVEADPQTGATPEPRLIIHLNRGKLLNVCELASTPEWAKPIALRALTS